MLNKSISLGWRSCLRSLPYWGRKWGGWSQDEEGPIYVNTGLNPFPHQIWKTTEELQVADSIMKSRKYLAVSLPPIWSLPSLGWKDWGPMLIQFFFFFWWKIALQFCVGFCHTTMQISHNYTYIPSLLGLPPQPHPTLSTPAPPYPQVITECQAGLPVCLATSYYFTPHSVFKLFFL